MGLSRIAEGLSTGSMLLSMLWRVYTRYPLLREILWLDALLIAIYAIHWFHSLCYHLRKTENALYLDKLWIGRMIHLRIVRLLFFIDSGLMRGFYTVSVILSLLRKTSLDAQNYLNYTLAFLLTTFFAGTYDAVYAASFVASASCFALGYWFWWYTGASSPLLVVLFHLMLGLKTYREEMFLQGLARAGCGSSPACPSALLA